MRLPTFRVALIAGTALAVPLIIGGVYLLRPGEAAAPPESSAAPPPTNRAGAGNSTDPDVERLRRQNADLLAAQAERSGSSYSPGMGGFGTREVGDPGPQHGTVRLEKQAQAPLAPIAGGTTAAPPPRPYTEQETKGTAEAMKALMATWGGRAPLVQTYGQPTQVSAPSGEVRLDRTMGGPVAGSTATRSAPAPQPATIQRRKRVLMEAGTGVLGQIVMGGNTDQGSPPIIVQAISGPIQGRRLIGTISRQGGGNAPNQLPVLRFTEYVGADGRKVPVDAIAVSPDTMESAVASRVDPNTMGRVVYPMAAAFAQGLGQALAMSGSFVSASPYGGFSALRQFSPAQMVGIGAGAAGAAAGQILREQAPRGPTTYLDARDEIGIVFLSALEVEE